MSRFASRLRKQALRFGRRAKSLALYIFLPVLLIAVWQGLYETGAVQALLLPPPSAIAATGWDLSISGELARHLGISLLRVLEGFALAALLGVVLGVGLGLSRPLDRATDLLIQLIKPIPPIAWIPLTILWFGIGEEGKVFIIFLGAFFPILVNTMDGIRQTDVKFVELARVLETSRLRFIAKVVLPGALPSIMTGMRVGMMVAWMCVVAAELIAASSGVGFLIMDARQMMQTDRVFVGMIAIGAIGKLLDVVLKKIERRLIRWKGAFQ
ncbi:MAG: ABC transporter permease [Alphaproteobacteria bacterium]|nr:ABC transporter permease [Alphaproteobacteria bacterium]